jgi:hypothetical protein
VVGQVDLAGDGDLDGVGQPGQVFPGARRGQQVLTGQLPELGVQQMVQSGGHLLGDAVHVVDGGHRGGHDKTVPPGYDSARRPGKTITDSGREAGPPDSLVRMRARTCTCRLAPSTFPGRTVRVG